ncbi:hypothetical protein F4X88_13455 [Candidatus Poribacteria bacterium]|nr:hypothetical protein [Candidatus Poribacteria bacterium]MYA57294.1 hypothetical protein [Candidatus Poribacteria bacterium]
MQLKHLFLIITALLTLPLTAIAQTEHTVFRHGGSVETVAYSPVNASLFASAGDRGAIKVWNLHNDTVTTLGRHADTVNSVAFSPDGNFLASGGDDYVLKVWNVHHKHHIATCEQITDRTRSQVKAVTFSPNGSTIATGGRHAKLWDARTYNEIVTFRHTDWVWAVAFSNDGRLLATGDNSGQVTVWDLQTQRSVTRILADSNAVYTVQFSPDAQILAGAGYEGKVKLWKAPNWIPYGTLTTNGTISNMSFSPDSSTLATTGYTSVNLWGVNIGENMGTLTGHTDWVRGTAFSPDGSSLISGGTDTTLRLWDVTSYRSTTPDMVRILYFLPRDRSLQPNIWTKMDTLIRRVQRFYADQMALNGFGRKTFTFETDANGRMLAYRVEGQFRDQYYHTDTANKVYDEVAALFDTEKHVYLIVADISSEFIGGKDKCGVGGGNWFENELLVRARGGRAVIPASGVCFEGAYGVVVTAHELGHAFGLEHDFRNPAYLMSYGAAPDRLSKCAASWLNANRFFNTDQTAFNEPTTIQMLTPSRYSRNARNFTLQFAVSDVDGIHQAQLLVPTTVLDPAPGIKLHSCKDLHTQSSLLEFSTPTLTVQHINNVVLQVIDIRGNITRRDYTLRAVNALVSGSADVNRDGIAAPEQLLATIAIPTETRIFANYPNPFNPETWIPYQLSEPAEVTLHLSCVDGTLVRTLALGHRAAGTYHSKSRAAYWDGRNEHGERVASGVYFYTLSAGDFTATRKMFIRK